MRNWMLFIGVALTMLLVSCTEQPFFEKVYSFDNNEWEQREKPTFEVDIKDTTKAYNFILSLRTTTDYEYNNLWIFWHTETPDGEVVREPFELKVSNPDGTWIGKNSGTIVENQLNFMRRKMPKKGKYIFTIEQGITEPKVTQVLDIGLKITEVKEGQ